MSDHGELRERVALALEQSWRYLGHPNTRRPGVESANEYEAADAVLAPLSLDDLDATIERGALALFEDHYGEKHGPAYMPIRDSRWWSYAEDSIRAALTPPEATKWRCPTHGPISKPATLTGAEAACPICCSGEPLQPIDP